MGRIAWQCSREKEVVEKKRKREWRRFWEAGPKRAAREPGADNGDEKLLALPSRTHPACACPSPRTWPPSPCRNRRRRSRRGCRPERPPPERPSPARPRPGWAPAWWTWPPHQPPRLRPPSRRSKGRLWGEGGASLSRRCRRGRTTRGGAAARWRRGEGAGRGAQRVNRPLLLLLLHFLHRRCLRRCLRPRHPRPLPPGSALAPPPAQAGSYLPPPSTARRMARRAD